MSARSSSVRIQTPTLRRLREYARRQKPATTMAALLEWVLNSWLDKRAGKLGK